MQKFSLVCEATERSHPEYYNIILCMKSVIEEKGLSKMQAKRPARGLSATIVLMEALNCNASVCAGVVLRILSFSNAEPGC
eukprot:3792883-Alexandrium_andersonii.AAC.1